MITIMIVEDEPPIARDLKKLIESFSLGFEVITHASNGYDALSFLDTKIPDIIFTDIQMPVIGGLELISKMREKGYDCEIVILSGYSDFEYAQKAVTLNIVDYLLKPVDKTKLLSLLENLSKIVINKQKSKQQSYFNSLLHQPSSSNPFEVFHESHYYIMSICAGTFPANTLDYYSPRKFFWEDLDFSQTFALLFPQNCNLWIIDGKTVAEKIVIFSSFDTSLETSEQLLTVTTQYFKNSALPVTCVLSKATNSIKDAGPLIKELRSMIHKHNIVGYSQFINQSHTATKLEELNEYQLIEPSTYQRLTQLIQKGHKHAFHDELVQIFAHWKAKRCPQIWSDKLLKKIISLFSDFIPNFDSSSLIELDLQINDIFAITNDYADLMVHCWYVFENLFLLRSNGFSQDESIELTMLRIDNYIVSHVSEAITAQTLSAMVGLVPSYLSKLFRDYKGMSPSEYLVHLRIQKAKDLIQKNPNIFAKDLSALIGYTDPLYFSKIFKKKTGVSLSDYKKTLKSD